MEYVCKGCDYTTTYQTNYKKHLETKKHKALKTDPFVCKYCHKGFSFKQSMYRHVKYTCKKNKDIKDIKEEILLLTKEREELEKQVHTQSKQIEKLMENLEIRDSFNKTTIQNNITLLPTDKDYNLNQSVQTLIEKLHSDSEVQDMEDCVLKFKEDIHLMLYNRRFRELEPRE
jgi:hypothetical protein